MHFILIFIILLAAFFLRAYPRILLPFAIASDTYFHLYMIKSIHENKGKYLKKDSRFLLNSECNYPYFYHWLLSLFGEPAYYFAERYSSAFFDSANCLIVYFFSFTLCSQNQINTSFAFAPTLIYAIHPALFRNGNEPRVYNGSSRVLGQTLHLLHMFGAFLFYTQHSLPGLCIAIISASLIFITTTFGVQVLFFFSLIFAFLYPSYPLFILASFLISLLLSRGRAGAIFKVNFEHYLFQFKNKIYYKRNYVLGHIRLQLLEFLRSFKLLISLNFKGFIRNFYMNTSPIQINLLGFHSFFIVFYWTHVAEYKFLYFWIVAGVFAFLFTKIPTFKFLGKPERYLEFALFPTFFLATVAGTEHSFFIYLAGPYFLFCLLGIYFYQKDFIDKYKIENDDFFKTQKMFSEFNTTSREGIIWALNIFSHKEMFFSTFPILGYYSGAINMKISSRDELDDLTGNHPFPSFELFRIIEKYRINYIITEKSYLREYLKKAKLDPKILQEKLTEIYSTDLMIIFKTT
jgi:hypothetical protein